MFYVKEVWFEKSSYSLEEVQRSGTVKLYASVMDDDGTPATPAEGTKVIYGIIYAYDISDDSVVHVITDSFDGRYYSAFVPLSLAGGVREGNYLIKVKAERSGIVQSLAKSFWVSGAQASPTYPPTWSNYTQQKFCNYPYRCESPDNPFVSKCTLIPDVTTCPQPQSCYKCPEQKACIGRCVDAAQAGRENCEKGDGDCPAPYSCYTNCKPQWQQPYQPPGVGGGQPQPVAGAFIGKGVAVSSSSASNYEVLAAGIKTRGKAFAIFKLGEKKFRTTEATYDDASRTFKGRIDGGSVSLTISDSQRISFGKLELGGAVYYVYLLRSGMAGGYAPMQQSVQPYGGGYVQPSAGGAGGGYGQPYGSAGGYVQQTQPYGGAGGQAGPYGGGYVQPYNGTQGGVVERIIQPPQPYAPMQAPSAPISPQAILPFAR